MQRQTKFWVRLEIISLGMTNTKTRDADFWHQLPQLLHTLLSYFIVIWKDFRRPNVATMLSVCLCVVVVVGLYTFLHIMCEYYFYVNDYEYGDDGKILSYI
jgi:hypothetical protein